MLDPASDLNAKSTVRLEDEINRLIEEITGTMVAAGKPRAGAPSTLELVQSGRMALHHVAHSGLSAFRKPGASGDACWQSEAAMIYWRRRARGGIEVRCVAVTRHFNGESEAEAKIELQQWLDGMRKMGARTSRLGSPAAVRSLDDGRLEDARRYGLLSDELLDLIKPETPGQGPRQTQ